MTSAKEKLPRIMLAAPASGSGKTLITCGILQALVNRGKKVSSFKCGPDYIDPMFHSRVIGTDSKNLDTFFTGPEILKYLFGETARKSEISVIEGVMGFYDGLGGSTLTGSSYELSMTLDSPVIMIMDCKGAATTIIALIRGLKDFRENNIRGVILNRMSASIYPEMKRSIESETGLKVIGYVPNLSDMLLESRHLGLILPGEVSELKERLNRLANRLEETLDIDVLIELATDVPEIHFEEPAYEKINEPLRIAVAADSSFCFTYADNIDILRKMGAEIIPFSPMSDECLPNDTDGLILSGGYPELHADVLSRNTSMRESIRNALSKGLPCIAECGGFMYLNDEMEDQNGTSHKMVGSLRGKCFRTNGLVRFGYITVRSKESQLILEKNDTVRGHEFHYWNCTDNGNGCTATKTNLKTEYDCAVTGENLFAGFPHLYFYSNLNVPLNFLRKCVEYKKKEKS